MTHVECAVFLDKFSPSRVSSGDKTATWLHLPPVVLLSPPTFWEAHDQPEPGCFFPCSLWGERRKTLGTRLVYELAKFLCTFFRNSPKATSVLSPSNPSVDASSSGIQHFPSSSAQISHGLPQPLSLGEVKRYFSW